MGDRTTLVSLAVIGLATVASGVVLLVLRRARLAGALLVATGAGLLGAVALAAAGETEAAAVLTRFTAFLLVPAAVMVYPVPRWRTLTEVGSLVLVLSLGLGTLLWWGTDVAGTLALLGMCALFGHTWWRIETSAERERRALQWMSLAVATTGLLAGFAAFSADGSSAQPALVLVALVGPAMVVGVALPELVDVRGVTVSVVVHSVCVVTVLTLFVGVVSLLDLAGYGDLSVGSLGVVAGLSAVLYHPLQVLLRGVVDEALFGGRRDPLDAASRVAGRVGDDPVLALRAIREALVLPYAAVRTRSGEVAAESGTPSTHTRSFPLEGAHAELVVGLRPGDLALGSTDQHVLRLAAPLLAQTLRARALAADLQESREATVTALEDERRRLRRDLHDGLGPRLSGIAFTSDAARNLVRTDPEAADALLRRLRADTTTAIEDIRRLVYGMRPPALDELGLVPALRQQSIGLRGHDGRALAVRIDVPDELPALPAAVEVAAYRIVLEALTNVARHTAAAHASVGLRMAPGGLAVEVGDDDTSDDHWLPGVGLSSMRERAAELGGTLTAGPTADGGRVQALLPVGPSGR